MNRVIKFLKAVRAHLVEKLVNDIKYTRLLSPEERKDFDECLKDGFYGEGEFSWNDLPDFDLSEAEEVLNELTEIEYCLIEAEGFEDIKFRFENLRYARDFILGKVK